MTEAVQPPRRNVTRRVPVPHAAQEESIRAADAPREPEARNELVDDEGEVLTRRSRADRQEFRFSIPERLKRPGWDYQFWAISIMGQKIDRSEMTDIYHGGWRPVKASEMSELIPPGTESDFIEEGGQRLFKRPMAFTLEAKAEEMQLAQENTFDRIRATTQGQTKDGPGLQQPGVRVVPLQAEITAEAGTYKGR